MESDLLLGLTKSGTPFDYSLCSISPEELHIALPHTAIQDKVDLCLYFYDPDTQALFKEANVIENLSKQARLQPISIQGPLKSFEEKSHTLLNVRSQKLLSEELAETRIQKSVQECLHIKQGFIIYLNHILPYISRITHLSDKEFRAIKTGYFATVLRKIEENVDALKLLLEGKGGYTRSLFESEITIEEFCRVLQTDEFIPYFESLKSLDKKLYYHYNLLQLSRT